MDDSTHRKKWILYPDMKLHNAWQVLISVLVLYECTLNPFRIAFNKEDTPFFHYFNDFITVMFFTDIVINFRTAYYDSQDQLVDKPKILAFNYMFSWFLIDLVATIPFEMFQSNDGNNFHGNETSSASFEVSGVLRITKVQKIFKLFKIMRLIRFGKFFKNSGEI